MRFIGSFGTALICGFCMMSLEILGARILQPVFGSGIDVWAAVISVFILSLSIGYAVGGRLADHTRDNRLLGWVVFLSGLLYLLLPIYARPLMDALGPGIHAARWGALLASAILYLPPSLLLGCVTPLLVTLTVTHLGVVGRTTGMLYAIGSVGNVFGVLVSDYFLLSRFMLNHILLGLGVWLGALGILHLALRMQRPETTAHGA